MAALAALLSVPLCVLLFGSLVLDFDCVLRGDCIRGKDGSAFLPPRRSFDQTIPEAAGTAAGSRAIVVFSNREMACSNKTWEDLRLYANRVNATLHHVRDLQGPEFQDVKRQCVRTLATSSIRFAKYAMMPFFLQRYDQVALLDDSVHMSKFAPDIFSVGADTPQAVKGTLDASVVKQSHCDTYRVPRDLCALNRRLVNSGLLVFSSQHHSDLFDEPCERWQRAGGFYDQALFNAMFMKRRTPIYDLNGDPEPHRCSVRKPVIGSGGTVDCAAFQAWVGSLSGCPLLFGSQLGILSKSGRLADVAPRACFAHVTRGSSSERDELICEIGGQMLCSSQLVGSDVPAQPAVDLLASPRVPRPLPHVDKQHQAAGLGSIDWASVGSRCAAAAVGV